MPSPSGTASSEEVHAAHTFTDANFEQEVFKFPGVVLVDFWATWCGPCRMQGPIVEKIAAEYAEDDRIKIGKVDVDANQLISSHFDIRSIPSLVFFVNGEPTGIKPGLTQEAALKQLIEDHIAKLPTPAAA